MMKKLAANTAIATVVAMSLLAGCSDSPSDSGASEKKDAAIAQSKYPDRVYWGDTHLHTSNSVDAFGFGVRLGPEDALRFASGEEVTASHGLKAKLARPLDFLVVADHAEGLGATRRLYEAPRALIRDPDLRRWYDMMHESEEGSLQVTAELITRAANGTLPKALSDPVANEKNSRSIWTENNDIVERYNKPGKFTAFIGFEYSLMPDGNNLHRVVMFRDGKDKADKVLPFSSILPGASPSKLWDYMDAYQKSTGGRVLAIPHNANLSNGLMFETVGPDGKPMTADYARRRAAHEPVVEITQIKGDSESHPFLSPNDEFASFGDAGWELGNLPLTHDATPDMYGGNYVREALKRGLAIEARTGVNPYQLGVIGSTDSHTALSTADENNFFGKHSGNEPNKDRASESQNLGTRAGRFGWQYLASGYAGVWATSNTRAAIFDALARREVYATTGPRMTVRFFGGWDFADSDLKGDWVKTGYERGVPMGAVLSQAKGAPHFIVSALKDPMGGNLDRAQVVKGWVDSSGEMHEKIYDVVWSDPAKRPKDANGKVPAVGNTVDIAKATYENSIGAPELSTVWTDPDFNPKERSFYYVRVLEIPTPRWVLFDVLRYGAKLLPGTELTSQERAYTSPIWYSPTS